MRFWDTSALFPLIVPSAHTASANKLVRDDPAIAVWWGTYTECVSACARLEREGRLAPNAMAESLTRLRAVARQWIEVPAGAAVREQASRVLRLHAVRAADALQLAAAIIAADYSPGSLPLITHDERLALAAAKEGFPVSHAE